MASSFQLFDLSKYYALFNLFSIDHPDPISLIPLSVVSFFPYPIFKFVHSNNCNDQLISFIKQFHPRSSFTFYTDSSIQNVRVHDIHAGIIWMETSTICPTQFQAAVDIYWILSTKTELLAIISAIVTVSVSSQVNIYTDSKSVINKFYHLILCWSSYFYYSRLTFKDTYSSM